MSYNALNPNGVAAADNSSPLTLAATFNADTARSGLALNYEFLTGTVNGWYDALGYTWLSFSVTTVALAGGVLTVESTNDTTNAPSGFVMPIQQTGPVAAARTTTVSLGGSSTRQFEGPITGRYIRIRLSTTFTGTSIKVMPYLTQYVPSMSTAIPVFSGSLPSGSNTIGTMSFPAATTTLGTVGLGSTQSVDVPSTVATLGGGSTGVGLSSGSPAASFSVDVTAVSGTSPTMDMVIQESYDNTTFIDVYHFDRITATGTYVTPVLRFNGSYIRFYRTLGGTSPSFTYSITRYAKPWAGGNFRTFIDRTINPNTLGSVTPAFYMQGCSQLNLTACVTSATSAALLGLQVAYEPLNWTTIRTMSPQVGTPLTFNNATLSLAKWVRVAVMTAGTSEVLNYVQITATGP